MQYIFLSLGIKIYSVSYVAKATIRKRKRHLSQGIATMTYTRSHTRPSQKDLGCVVYPLNNKSLVYTFKVLPRRGGGGWFSQIEHSLLLFSTHNVRDCHDSRHLLANTDSASPLNLHKFFVAELSVGTT
jgi:hypothetical protein